MASLDVSRDQWDELWFQAPVRIRRLLSAILLHMDRGGGWPGWKEGVNFVTLEGPKDSLETIQSWLS